MSNTIKKRYLVTGTWWDKKKDRYVSGIAEVNGGVNKEKKNWETTDTESYNDPIEGTYPVGTILTATVSFDPQADTGKTPNVKLNQASN